MSTRFTFRQVLRSIFEDYRIDLLNIIKESTTKHNEVLGKLDIITEVLKTSTQESITLRNGEGDSITTRISEYRALKVYDQRIPDVKDKTATLPITQFLLDDLGSNDMRANASLANPVDFTINANQDFDIYLNTLSFLISDQNAVLSNFGAITELTNGCQLIYSSSDTGEVILADNLTTNYSFIRLCTDTIGISDNVSAYRADNISGNSEGYSAVLNFNNAFGTSFGLRLKAGSLDKLILRVRDNVSGIDAFNCLTYGIKFIR